MLLLQLQMQKHKTAARLLKGTVLHTWEMPELSYETFYSLQRLLYSKYSLEFSLMYCFIPGIIRRQNGRELSRLSSNVEPSWKAAEALIFYSILAGNFPKN